MKKMTTEDFIKRSVIIHNRKYDYSKSEYNGNRKKVCIICPVHGEFWQEAASHLRGNGCPKCGFESGTKQRNLNTDEFIKKAKGIHGEKYDYSKVEYVNMKTKVCIICPKHGEFWQTPLNHLNSNGCKKCGREHFSNTHNKGTESFIKDAMTVHSDRYDYSKVKYVNSKIPVCIICPTHGEFWQKPNYHLCGKGCPKCNESHLEREIRHILEDRGVKYLYQCGKEELPWLGNQTLDFYLPEYGVAIECQGSQHFFSRENDLFSHKKTLERDIKKNIKCSINKTKLIYYSDLEFNKDIILYNEHNSFTDKEKLINKIML